MALSTDQPEGAAAAVREAIAEGAANEPEFVSSGVDGGDERGALAHASH